MKRTLMPSSSQIELIKSYRQEDFRPVWDYRGEDPFRDERGFRADTLSNHPDEKEEEARDQKAE